MISLTISGNTTLAAASDEFNRAFPYLKLGFFKHKHKAYAPSPKSGQLQSGVTFKQLHKKAANATISISEDMQVLTVEKMFYDKFGIPAQVFRKSGRAWLETSLTDDWTLGRQNDEGRELSSIAL